MTDPRTLRVFERLLAELDRVPDDASRPLVRPIVHDALGPEEQLLRHLCEDFGGRYIPVADRGAGAVAPVNGPLLRIVKQRFARERLEIDVEERDGRLVARYLDHAAPAGGLATLLRAAEVLVSDEIDSRIVVMSYPLAGLDTSLAALLWELCGLAISTHPPGRLRLFVPLAAGEVSVGSHCLKNNPVRFAVQNGRIIERGDAKDLDDAVRAMVLSRTQPLVLFLGAGASASAGIGVGDGIRDEALTELIGHHPTTEAKFERFRRFLDEKNRWRIGERELPSQLFDSRLTLERVLRERFHRLGGRPRALLPEVKRLQRACDEALSSTPPGRKAVRELAEKLPRLVIATINFDRLIEDGMPVDHRVVATPEAFEIHRRLVVDRVVSGGTTLPILKVHGTIEALDTLVADVDTTDLGLPKRIERTLDELVAAAAPLTWVWIGCSMRDLDMGRWLAAKSGVRDLNEWWIDPLPSTSLFDYATYVRRAQWAQLDQSLTDRLVTETADVFLEALSAHASTLAH